MNERVLDQYNGITEYYSQDPITGKITIRESQDVAPVLKSNNQIKSIESGNWKGDLHHVASIPQVLWSQWWKELGSNPMAKENRKWLLAKLNDKDYLKLRTKSGNL